MKTYSVAMGRRNEYPHPAPDRTAYRVSHILGVDDFYQVWSNRKAMARSIRMQQKAGIQGSRVWHPMIPLTDGEGY